MPLVLSSDYQRQVRTNYDNDVLYCDYVLDKMIQFFEDKYVHLLSLSDHSEEAR